MRRRIPFLVSLVLVTVLLAGCFKKVRYETTYVLEPWVELTSGGEKVAYLWDTIRCYAFPTDTTDWTVASYQDALDGVVTSLRTGERLAQPMASGEPYRMDGNENWLAMTVSGPSVMIVAVDTYNRLYGFRQQGLGANLSQMYVQMTFRPWKRARTYTDGDWLMFNEFYDPSVELIVRPLLQAEETSAAEPCPGVVTSLFYAEAGAWTVGSYADARAGVITSADGTRRTDPDARGVLMDEGTDQLWLSMWLRPENGAENVVLIAADTVNRLYGFCDLEVSDQKPYVSYAVTFCPWREEYSYRESGWTMRNDRYASASARPQNRYAR